jgi:hypothetical protein
LASLEKETANAKDGEKRKSGFKVGLKSLF